MPIDRLDVRSDLEVRIPISPRPDYFHRVYLLARSIKQFYPDAIFRVSVGDDDPPFDIASRYAWSDELDVTWNWIDRADFAHWRRTAHPYIATMMDRFKSPFQRDFVIMLDADILVVERFDELFSLPPGLSAVMAHGPPFGVEHRSKWHELFARYGLELPRFEHEHSGWLTMFDVEDVRLSPLYFNTGVLFGRRTVYESLESVYLDALDFVRSETDSYFFEQIALTLALARSGIHANVLPLRYNFPNQPEFDARHPDELAQVRFLHYLRTSIVDRERDFADFDSFSRLLARDDLRGSNQLLRRSLSGIPCSAADFTASIAPRS